MYRPHVRDRSHGGGETVTVLAAALNTLTPADVLEGLAAHLGVPAPHFKGTRVEGVLCDFRSGCEEKDPSLSYGLGEGGPVFKRFGRDDFGGGAVAFLESAGLSKADAARLLIEWAGLQDDRRPGQSATRSRNPGRTAKRKPAESAFDGDALLSKQALQGPVQKDELNRVLRGWVRIEADEDSPEARMLAGRGLLPAVASGLLVAYRFGGNDGRRLPPKVLRGAVAFELRGPDGRVWGVKIRNPGTKADLKAAKATRYVYGDRGYHIPPWCSPGYSDAPVLPALLIEGELNAVAVCLMLEAVGLADVYRVQGVGSATYSPHTAGLSEGTEAFILTDLDEDGDKARQQWARLCAHVGAAVRQVRNTPDGSPVFTAAREGGTTVTSLDACEALGMGGERGSEPRAAHYGARLRAALAAAPIWAETTEEPGQPSSRTQGAAGDVWLSKREGFGLRQGVLCALSMKKSEVGEEYEVAETLANFAAFITAEVQTKDGTGEAPLTFEIAGRWATGEPMLPLAPPVITAAEFNGMAWPVRIFGARAIVRNGQGRKDKAREAVQHLSNAAGFPTRTVYSHTGWIDHDEHGPLYLTAGAVIGRTGAVPDVVVDLGAELDSYALPDPAGHAEPYLESGAGEDVRQAVRASLAILDLAPDEVAVPVMGAVYRAPLGRADFAVWGTGETGRNKTALMGLAQAHFGAKWNRHRLPEGWQSTANALEKTAFMLKDVLLIVDDFKPGGTQTDMSRAHGNLTRVLQGVADGTGRGRLGIDGKRRAGLAPRGTVMSSSETLPRGHSNRARVVVVPVESKLIHNKAMSEAYYAAEDAAGRGVYALAIAGFVQFIAAHFDDVRVGSAAHKAMTRALAPNFEGAHGRTGPAAAELAYGHAAFLTFAVQLRAITEEQATRTWMRVVTALQNTASGQGEHLQDEDPVNKALSILGALLSQGAVFLEEAGGEKAKAPPVEVAHLYGWQNDPGEGVDLRTRPGGRLVGYYSKTGGDEWGYFIPDLLHGELQRAAQAQGTGVLPDASTLYGNMKDRFSSAGLMRCEVEKGGAGKAGRVRPYWKASPRGQRGRFVALRLPIDLEVYAPGTVGTLGTDGERRASSTSGSSIPSFNIFSE